MWWNSSLCTCGHLQGIDSSSDLPLYVLELLLVYKENKTYSGEMQDVLK